MDGKRTGKIGAPRGQGKGAKGNNKKKQEGQGGSG